MLNIVKAKGLARADGVSRTFRAGAVDVCAVVGASLGVAAGEVVALTGPSGSGKSTLLAILGGLLPPDSGSVTVAGVDLYGLRGRQFDDHRRRHVGFVFQDYNLMRSLTALENVALTDELDGLPRTRANDRALRALHGVGMAEEASRFPYQLSGGQQQRVAIARALVGGSKIILADEPTGALDSVNAGEVLDLIERIAADGGGCVIATHDPSVAARAGRVVVMKDGRITSDERQ